MAIFYYDDIDLATNQLLDVALEVISDVDNVTGFTGRIAFDQATDTFSFYNGTAWVDLTGTGGLVSLSADNGVEVDTTTGDVTISPRYQASSPLRNFIAEAANGVTLDTAYQFLAYQDTQTPSVTKRPISDILSLITTTGGVESVTLGPAVVSTVAASPLILTEPTPDNFVITPQIYGGTDKVGYVPSSASLGVTYYLRGDGTWKKPDNVLGGWTISDSTNTYAVTNGVTIDFEGGVGIVTTAGVFGVFDEVKYDLDLTDSSLQITDAGTVSTDSLAYSEYANLYYNILAELSDAPLNVFGAASADISMTTSGTAYKITGLSTTDPSDSSDIVDKKFVDDTAGEVFNFQGGYDAANNLPDLTTSPNSITKGQAWAVTSAGTFYGEQLRDGDFLIANDDDPSTLAMWEVAQNNVGLASNTAFGIAYYDANSGMSMAAAGEPELDSVANNVGSFGANDKSLTISTDEFGRVTDIAASDIVLPASAASLAADTGQVSDFSTEVKADINAKSFAGTYGGVSMVVNHALGTENVIVQAYRNSGLNDTINFKVTRTNANNVTLTTPTTLGANSVRVLVQTVTT
tara:strand:+ start:4753 stop:6483 length:1731 start_codon:yes stop_codon:yes gene_type:complete